MGDMRLFSSIQCAEKLETGTLYMSETKDLYVNIDVFCIYTRKKHKP